MRTRYDACTHARTYVCTPDASTQARALAHTNRPSPLWARLEPKRDRERERREREAAERERREKERRERERRA